MKLYIVLTGQYSLIAKKKKTMVEMITFNIFRIHTLSFICQNVLR